MIDHQEEEAAEEAVAVTEVTVEIEAKEEAEASVAAEEAETEVTEVKDTLLVNKPKVVKLKPKNDSMILHL